MARDRQEIDELLKDARELETDAQAKLEQAKAKREKLSELMRKLFSEEAA